MELDVLQFQYDVENMALQMERRQIIYSRLK